MVNKVEYIYPSVGNVHLLMTHRRSQDFVWGALFLTKKVDDLFLLVVALKERLNTPPNLTRAAKTVLKIDSCSGWGCTSYPRGCIYTFSM